MEYLNSLLDICQDNEIYFAKANAFMSNYRKANRLEILKNAKKLNYKDLLSVATDFIKRKIK